jgi:hypothetical protein
MITCIYSILGTTSINIGVKCFDYIDYLLSAETPETNTSLRKRFAIHVSYKIPPLRVTPIVDSCLRVAGDGGNKAIYVRWKRFIAI